MPPLSAKACPSCGSTNTNGPGYRVYYKQQGRELVILLAGGDKRTQTKDIVTALRLARDL
jgi:putative addiction module killer protein